MTFSYADTRDSETLRLLEPAIDAFIAGCQNPPRTKTNAPRQTLLFFPGGIASQLSRATAKFVDGVETPQTFEYKPLWLTPEALTLGSARDLRLHRDSGGTFRDKGDYIIVADAPLGFRGSTPHDGLIAWCAKNNVDLFVFPWDWRRRLDEIATFFVGKFLPHFRARVRDAGCPDPLARFSLVGHSFGGMIVNLILRNNDPIVVNVTHVITVGTPFYGYPGQMHRWFEGEPLYLNGDSDVFKQDMMETIASLPALYTLQLLDEVTYSNATTQAALAAHDRDFPLPPYPSVDATSGSVRADPYNPRTNGSLVRYPLQTGFDRGELDYARVQLQQLAAPMDGELAAKFYNIRGVVTADDDQTPRDSTYASVSWDWIPGSFDSADQSPIADDPRVPGDDTQPAWTARLATNDPRRWITVRAHDLSHACMMNHPFVLNAIGTILCPEGTAARMRRTPQPEPAADDDVVEFLAWLSDNGRRVRAFRRFDDRDFLAAVPKKFSDKLDAIARRILMDILKRPAPNARGTRRLTSRKKPR